MLQIPPDYTFLVQIAIFVVLWLVLKRLWFDPALRILHARRARSEGAIAEARAVQAEAERMRAEHAAAMDQARSEAEREVHEIVRQAEVEQKRLIDDAREEAQRTMADARRQITAEVSAARQGLLESAHDIA